MLFSTQTELLDKILSPLSLSDLKSLGLTCKKGHLLCNKLIQKYTIKNQVEMVCGDMDSFKTFPQVIDSCITLSDENILKLSKYLIFLRDFRSGHYGIKFSDFLKNTKIGQDINEHINDDVLSMIKWIKIHPYSSPMYLFLDHIYKLTISSYIQSGKIVMHCCFYNGETGEQISVLIDAYLHSRKFEDLNGNNSYVHIAKIKQILVRRGIKPSDENVTSFVNLVSKLFNCNSRLVNTVSQI